jgi:hypothetical protein
VLAAAVLAIAGVGRTCHGRTAASAALPA